ncbi:MAG: hypothetical protein J1F24_02600 [Oscillospiraceae bacterium]|nr:hypothetical protein [Oscillospiraceae bacterium]
MKNNNFVIIGGDKRQKYLGEYLKKCGNSVSVYGLYDWDDDTERLKTIITPKSVIILPLPVSKNGKTIFMPFSKRELPLNRLLSLIGSENKVFGGMFSEDFSDILKEKNIPFYDYYDSAFVSENAYLTAFGTLKIILEHIDFAVSQGVFAITGYGRVGRETAELLKKLSCDVTVFARSEEARTDASLRGCKAEELCKLSEAADKFDIIINTIPHRVIDAETLQNIRTDCKIIELASAPFGVNPEEAEKYSVSVIKAPGLPGKYTAKTAGELIGKKIVKTFQKEEKDE